MKSPYTVELQPNQIVTATLVVQQKDIRQKKSGEPCLSLVLGDRTGDIEARMWDNVAEVMDTFDREDFVKVRGLVQIYQNRLQLTVHKIQRQPSETVDFTDFFPASERNAEEMWSELLGIIDGIQDRHLKQLLTLIVSDSEIAKRYRIAPAAKTVHHAFLGGLLEHVLSMAAIARLLAPHYPSVDLDLLLTGIVLHDVGKIYELSYDRSFGYSSEGQLLGHIVIGLRMIGEKIHAIPDFPPRLRTLVEHLLVSHHGELEFGSPKLPMFGEALLLHHIDNIDSKMDCIRTSLHKDRLHEGCWTGYNPALERPILKKSKYIEGAPADTATTPVAEPPPAPFVNAAVAAPKPPAPVMPNAGAKPASTSLFGEKLQGALRSNS
jgi:3'-5' exoribonuclease